MRARKPESQLEDIPAVECWDLLARHDLGRIAIAVEGKPQIFPVNYGLKGKVIVFRTAAGTKLAYAPESPVAFEVDEYDASAGTGWSVQVQGFGRDVTEAADDFSWTARGARVHPAAPGYKLHMIAVDPTLISGRRFGPRHGDPGGNS